MNRQPLYSMCNTKAGILIEINSLETYCGGCITTTETPTTTTDSTFQSISYETDVERVHGADIISSPCTIKIQQN